MNSKSISDTQELSKELLDEKMLLIEFLKGRFCTQEETLKSFHQNIERIVSSKEASDKKQQALSESEALYKAINALYKEASAVQKPFGEIIKTIMEEKGFTKSWHGHTLLDIPRAAEVTKLSQNVFRTNMYKPNCVVDMSLIMSMCIGFKLSPVLTDRLLQSAGLAFRLDNPEHLAYLFLLEYCMDLSVTECNEILKKLGVPKTKRLGSYGRGKDGETLEYKSKKPQ